MKKTGLFRLLMAGAILVVLLNTWVAERALNKLFTAQDYLSHTLVVLTHTESMALNMRAADSAVRGYILTGVPIFEQRYHTAVQAVYDQLDQVQELTGDDDAQQRQLAYLRTRISAKMGVLDEGLDIRKGHLTGTIDPVLLDPVLSDTPGGGQSVEDVIRQVEVEEHRLIAQRTQATKTARREAWISFIVASGLDILLLIAAFELLIHAHDSQQKIEEGAAEIAMLNSELREVNADLEFRVEQRTRELEISNRELEAFSYSVSHDLRAPLRTIDGFSLALQEDFAAHLNDMGRDYITRVRNGVQRMGSLIDALLQLSRVTRSDLQRDTVDLSQLAALVFSELQIGDPNRVVAFTAQPNVIAKVDPRLVRVAFENLMGNAWKFTSRTENPRIEFGSDMRDGRAVYFLRDNGAGFDMQYVDRLFTAFQRLHGDRDFKGSGIGLATVSRIIRRHHGTIWAESSVGQGATFFFTLGVNSFSASGTHLT